MTQAQQVCYDSQEIPPSTPISRFIENNDGTVSDTQTSLMWSKCYVGHSGLQCEVGGTGTANNPTRMNWQDALNVAQSSNLAGHNDWRLPNIKELITLIERSCYGPAMNLTVFPRTPLTQSSTWSSSKSNLFDEHTFVVNYVAGNTITDARTTNNYVRLVRTQ